MILKNLLFEVINNDATKFTLTVDDSYVNTYPYFLKYFSDIEEIDEYHLTISSHFVYGWMPTIIHLDLSKKNKILKLLNEVKRGHLLTESELGILKKAINNSLVGLSKLLHFINPKEYAIGDSRIFSVFNRKEKRIRYW